MLWDINIQKTYRSRDRQFAIEISFQSDSKRLVLFGPSGAGKTQVLKMLSGLINPDKGHIQFLNNDLFNSDKRIFLTPPTTPSGICVPKLCIVSAFDRRAKHGLFTAQALAEPTETHTVRPSGVLVEQAGTKAFGAPIPASTLWWTRATGCTCAGLDHVTPSCAVG